MGLLEPGSVQWMTAGRGVIHSELPEQREGRMAGFQLWLNLPAKGKTAAVLRDHRAIVQAIEQGDAAAAEQLFGGNPPFDRLEERPDLIVALRARADIHVAAFAGHWKPGVLSMDKACHAKARPRT